MLALDHYSSIVGKLGKENLLNFKKDILKTLGLRASAVLIDIDYGLPAYKESNIDTPFILKAGSKENPLEPALTPQGAKTRGASALKLLARSPISQKKLICSLAKEARNINLPFILEITPPRNELEKLLMEILSWEIPISVYKLPYPGLSENCQRVSNMLKNTPWVMLSGGDNFKTFLANYKTAKQGGASGFLAGRSLWQEALDISNTERKEFIAQNIIPKWEELTNLKEV